MRAARYILRKNIQNLLLFSEGICFRCTLSWFAILNLAFRKDFLLIHSFIFICALLLSSTVYAQDSSWLEFAEWDKLVGEAATLSEEQRLDRLKVLIEDYLVEQPEFLFHWAREPRAKILSKDKFSINDFKEIYKNSTSVPKGFYQSTDPFDSENYGTDVFAIRLPKAERKFINLMALLPVFRKLGYINAISNRMYSDFIKIGIKGVIWGDATWSFLFAPIQGLEVLSLSEYLDFLEKNPAYRARSYPESSLDLAIAKIQNKCVNSSKEK